MVIFSFSPAFHRGVAFGVVMHPERVFRDREEVALVRCEIAHDVGRTTDVAQAGNMAVVVVVAPQFVLLAVPAQRIGVGPLGTIQLHAGKNRVVPAQLHDFGVAGVAGGLQHAPVPHHVADHPAGFVVGGGIGQIERRGDPLVNRLPATDLALAFDKAAGDRPLVHGADAAGDVHLLFGQVLPQPLERIQQASDRPSP